MTAFGVATLVVEGVVQRHAEIVRVLVLILAKENDAEVACIRFRGHGKVEGQDVRRRRGGRILQRQREGKRRIRDVVRADLEVVRRAVRDEVLRATLEDLVRHRTRRDLVEHQALHHDHRVRARGVRARRRGEVDSADDSHVAVRERFHRRRVLWLRA